MTSNRRARGRRAIITLVAVAACLAVVVYLGAQKKFQAAQYLQLVLDGLSSGSLYALIALGFVVIHNVTGIINFAQGEFVMLGAMLSVTFYAQNLPVPPALKLVLAIFLAVLATTLVGVTMERLTMFPARQASTVTLIIITIGATIIIRAAALLIWSSRPYSLVAFSSLELEDVTLRWGSLLFKMQTGWIWGVVAIVLLALFFFFEWTLMGKALRACAINRRAAQLMGISPSRMSTFSFGLAAAIGALGGAVLAPATRPTYDMGLILGLKGFVAAIMGGLVSSPGAVLGGLVLGMLENVGAGVTSAGARDLIAFVILILLLLFRPRGILGGVERGIEER